MAASERRPDVIGGTCQRNIEDYGIIGNMLTAALVGKAVAIFERLLALHNDLGLLSKEYDTLSGRMLGNFPQAFSHIGLINTAHNLLRVDGPARERAQRRG